MAPSNWANSKTKAFAGPKPKQEAGGFPPRFWIWKTPCAAFGSNARLFPYAIFSTRQKVTKKSGHWDKKHNKEGIKIIISCFVYAKKIMMCAKKKHNFCTRQAKQTPHKYTVKHAASQGEEPFPESAVPQMLEPIPPSRHQRRHLPGPQGRTTGIVYPN